MSKFCQHPSCKTRLGGACAACLHELRRKIGLLDSCLNWSTEVGAAAWSSLIASIDPWYVALHASFSSFLYQLRSPSWSLFFLYRQKVENNILAEARVTLSASHDNTWFSERRHASIPTDWDLHFQRLLGQTRTRKKKPLQACHRHYLRERRKQTRDTIAALRVAKTQPEAREGMCIFFSTRHYLITHLFPNLMASMEPRCDARGVPVCGHRDGLKTEMQISGGAHPSEAPPRSGVFEQG